MALSFDDLKRVRPTLEPVEVPIEGLKDTLLLHQFTLAQLTAIDSEIETDDQEEKLRHSVLRFMKGPDAEIDEDDHVALREMFAGWQLRKIFTVGLKLNGHGPAALREAEKN